MNDHDKDPVPFLEIRELTKCFGEETVIRGLNLTLERDHIYCLMGPSGTGKTTLLRLIMGLLKPDSGSIIAHDRLTCSAVFQEDRLLDGFTAEENLRFVTGSQYSTEELREMILQILPEDCLKKPVAEFSGGMKRRVAILRALLPPSDMVLMDEPFTGLDHETRKKVIRLILEKRGSRLLLISTHEEEDAELLSATILRPYQ